jgi:arginine utilization regulatory protein
MFSSWLGLLEPVLNELFLGALIADVQGRIVYYNKSMGELDELAPEEALGYKISEVYAVRDTESPTMTAIRTGRPVLGRYMVYKTARGRQIASLNHAYPLHQNGQVVGALCLVTDISSLTAMVMDQIKGPEPGGEDEPGPSKVTFKDLIGKNPVFCEALEVAKIAAAGPSSVMLIGETGSGKDLLAQAIHNYGPRRQVRFLALNCSAIPEALLEGLLFGTTKGAFTGAIEKPGLLEQASGGTLFLDEINSMPVSLQPKLLRVLADGRVRRVGGLEEKAVDLRLISAISVNPHQAIAGNSLRADLYYRLGVIQVRIPPLRERPEDIPYLAEYFLKKCGRRLNRNVAGIAPEVLADFRKRNWPGNVRELEHVIESALNFLSSGEYLSSRHIKRIERHFLQSAQAGRDGPNPPNRPEPPRSGHLTGEILNLERERLAETLKRNNGRLNRTAAALGISPQLLSYKMHKHGLDRKDFLD